MALRARENKVKGRWISMSQHTIENNQDFRTAAADITVYVF
jgi:hypothetical protein